MRKTSLKLGAIGASIGLALAASAISPAHAAPPAPAPTVTTTACSVFQGATAFGSTYSVSSVSLKAGDTITSSISPAAPGDTIVLFTATWLSFAASEGPASGFTFTAPTDGVYNLDFSVNSATPTASVAWSFSSTCASTTVVTAPVSSKPVKGGGKGR